MQTRWHGCNMLVVTVITKYIDSLINFVFTTKKLFTMTDICDVFFAS